IGIIGVLFLIFAAVGTFGRQGLRWRRIALSMAGIVFIGWGLLGLVFLNLPSQPWSLKYSIVQTIKSTVGGMGLGIVLLLLLSGEIKLRSASSTDGKPKA